ncbi:uncharacterized protein LOC133794645 [Humulus lupulus]|uniref:uncharacterized protein LOC133794645 n=1 Tax=Humulus lupulus TaxID=3486 RepID=UPI002B414B3B|nr:uncharacterized protein LOC133794645 [Humulus lupulus]
MRTRVVVFPVRGKNWCFSTSIQPLASESESATALTPSTIRDLFSKLSFSTPKPLASNAELLVDFVAHKMNKAWTVLEKAPEGTLKNKIHGLGLRLLAGVKPSEMFLKSIPKEATTVEVTYPSSLNPLLVRRRLRHIALRGTIIHKKYFYGSVSLLPLTSAFTILPLPNIPFFWVLFRTYSHWRALQGSEQLLQLVSDGSQMSSITSVDGEDKSNEHATKRSHNYPWVLRPSRELEELVQRGYGDDGLSKCAISNICSKFDLNPNDVLKYRESM